MLIILSDSKSINIYIYSTRQNNLASSKLRLFTLHFDFADLSVECFEKSRRGRPLLPLQSLHGFEIIYQGPSPQARVGQRRTSSSSPIRAGTHSSPTRSTSRAFLKESSPGSRSSTRENIFVSRSLSKDKNESKLQRAATETLALSTVKEDDVDIDAAAGKTNNGFSTSDEDVQENANEATEDATEKDTMNEKRRKKETRRNVPKATRTSFDNDSEASKSGGRVRSIQNDLSLQGRSKKVLPKESAKPLPVPLVQSNSASGVRKSAFPPLIEYSSSPYASKQQSTTDPVKLRMSHGANTPARSKSRAKELETANRGS